MKFVEYFEQLFDAVPIIVLTPGRISLIGEHADYNGGYAIPAAIDRYIYLAVSAKDDSRMVLFADEFGAAGDEILPRAKAVDYYSTRNWIEYVKAASSYLSKYGANLSENEKAMFQKALDEHQ